MQRFTVQSYRAQTARNGGQSVLLRHHDLNVDKVQSAEEERAQGLANLADKQG